MIIEAITQGIGRGEPLILKDVTQVVIKQDNGTPIMVAAHYGPQGGITVGSVGHNKDEFNRVLSLLGYHTTVIVDRTLQAFGSVPSGAKLFAKPRG